MANIDICQWDLMLEYNVIYNDNELNSLMNDYNNVFSDNVTDINDIKMILGL